MYFSKKYIKKYWKPFFSAVLFLTFETICDLMQPTIMSKIIDIGVAGKNMNYVLKMGGLMLLITALGAVAAVSRNIISSNVSLKFGTELRRDIYIKINTYSFENIDKFETASLVTRLTNDVTQVQNFINGLMRIFVKAPLLCIGSLVMATRLNPSLAIVLAVVVPIIGVFIFANMKIGYPFFKKVQKAMDAVNGGLREYLSGARVVKAFNRFDYEQSRFDKTNVEMGNTQINAMRVMAIFAPGITLTVNIGIVVVLWLGGFNVNNGNMQVGQVIAFTNYMTQILFSLMMISFVFTMFVRAKSSAERINEVLIQENSMKVLSASLAPSNETGSLEFQNVYFSYAGTSGEPVIKNITFSCARGETIGIIGSTGSGKSSLINLLPRFYDVTSGTVKVSGIDVKYMDPKKLREKIAMVPQKTTLFTGTVMENIKWGKEDATALEVQEAAVIAMANDFITSSPEGYDTKIGQGGVNFSGGQKQRVSIARALIRKPEILILDDCTSSVDVATETKIRLGLKEYLKDLTCVIIAQRITSIMETDKIIVLDNGEMVGIGTHEHLMLNCDVYQDIFRSQLGKQT